jgi:hypothetical protein
MATPRLLEPTVLTTPKGEEVVLLTLSRAEWQALHPVLENSLEAEKLVAFREDSLDELASRLEDLEAGQSSREKQAWQEAVNKAKPATYVPGQGAVVL